MYVCVQKDGAACWYAVMLYAGGVCGEHLQHNKKLPQLTVCNYVCTIFCAEEFPEVLHVTVQYIKQQFYKNLLYSLMVGH